MVSVVLKAQAVHADDFAITGAKRVLFSPFGVRYRCEEGNTSGDHWRSLASSVQGVAPPRSTGVFSTAWAFSTTAATTTDRSSRFRAAPRKTQGSVSAAR